MEELGARGTPTAAMILSAFVACVLLLFFSNHFQELASISVIATLVSYAFICVSAFKIFSDDSRTKFIGGIGALTTLAFLVIYFFLSLFSIS